MALLDESAKSKIKEFLTDMEDEVQIEFFTQEIECNNCKQTHQFLTEVAELSNNLSMTVYDFVENEDIAKEKGIERIPAVTLLDKDGNDYGIKFYGVPGGYEVNSFLKAILEVSGNEEEIDDEIMERINNIGQKVNIKVFVSLSCPYCPKAVQNAHTLALKNENITGEMIETSSFPELTNKYNVSGVPQIVINEENELVGAQPITKFLDIIESL